MREWLLILVITMLVLPLYLNIYYDLNESTIYLVDATNTKSINSSDIYIKSKIKCGSDSMGLIVDCKDTVYSKLLESNESLKVGSMYIYKDGKREVIHRLVKDCSVGCFGYIFKGDNNYRADNVIKRSDIVREVVQIGYS